MNSAISNFIIKALLVFGAWYILYELWLLPDGRLDYWLSMNTLEISGGILKTLGYEIYTVNRVIGIGEAAGVQVINGCNGLSSMGLFVGFILAYPAPWVNKFTFSVMGILMLYLINILRITSLVFVQQAYPAYFDFMHEYSTSALFYLIIFMLWMYWVRSTERIGIEPG